MGVPTSEVGYTPAMPRTEDHEVHKRTCGDIGKKKRCLNNWADGQISRNILCDLYPLCPEQHKNYVNTLRLSITLFLQITI
jgi:hypothetical protein